MSSYLTTTAALYAPVSEEITAQELHADHLDRLVHFAYTEPTTMLEILVIGELREVHHEIRHDAHGSDHTVTIWVTGRDNRTGDKREFQLAHHAAVVLVQD